MRCERRGGAGRRRASSLRVRASASGRRRPTDVSREALAAAAQAGGRRAALARSASAAAAAALLWRPRPAVALQNGAVSDAWGAVTGAKADLVYPAAFLGEWRVESTVTGLELPRGSDAVPDAERAVVMRTAQERAPRRYTQRFVRNGRGEPVSDRAYNTMSLAETYVGAGGTAGMEVDWDIDDPNVMRIKTPRGGVFNRVTRRFEDDSQPNRLDTSEVFEQIFDNSDAVDAPPRVKSSRCLTKYKWRDEAAARAAGGPTIVATQVVSDFLTAFDGVQATLESQGEPVVVTTYRLTFTRAP